VGDQRLALFYSGLLFLPAALIALRMPVSPEESPPRAPELRIEPDAAPANAPANAAIAHQLSAEEERAILEEIYRERGCSG
jgi:hypothetical protein